MNGLTSDTAECFSRNAKIRSDHVQWNAVKNVGKAGHEIQIPLFRCVADSAHDPVLYRVITSRQERFYENFKFRNRCQ